MSTRLLIIVLVLLVVLFAVGIGMGGMPRGDAQGISTWVTGLQDMLLRAPPRLTAADIDLALPAACGEQFAQGQLRLAPGQGCVFFIGRAQAPVRSLLIEFAPGQIGQVRFDPAGSNRFSVHQELKADRRSLKVDVYQEGGELHVDCVLASVGDACLLTVE